ncbi:HvfA family oxazolone/thioamide-modified RiPP metallophore [Microvirga soli]|uniref:HvfA family oxazolone/thioamide-modified RiPP metallophore n=1 Tax=Microvirga soli TaxID=1854496 RepID=UPI00406BA0A7
MRNSKRSIMQEHLEWPTECPLPCMRSTDQCFALEHSSAKRFRFTVKCGEAKKGADPMLAETALGTCGEPPEEELFACAFRIAPSPIGQAETCG